MVFIFNFYFCRHEFIKLYLDWLLNTSVDERFRAFYLGFHSVCASNALIMLRPEEVEQLGMNLYNKF